MAPGVIPSHLLPQRGVPLASVSQVETTSPTGPLLHTSQVAVEHQIGTAFSHCFQGANGTPFLSPPLLHCVGMDGSSAAAQSIWDGTFDCPPEVDDYTRKFISSLCRPCNMPPSPSPSLWPTSNPTGSRSGNAPPPHTQGCTLDTTRQLLLAPPCPSFMQSLPNFVSPMGSPPSVGSQNFRWCLKRRPV